MIASNTASSADHIASEYNERQIHTMARSENVFLSPNHQDPKTPGQNIESKVKRRSSDLRTHDPSVTILPNGAVKKFQKARQRKVLSCVTCHQKKIKCSRDHPVCVTCSKNNLECKYYVNSRVSRGGKNTKKDNHESLPDENRRKSTVSCGSSIASSHPSDIKDEEIHLNPVPNDVPLIDAQNNNWNYNDGAASSKMSASSSLFSNTNTVSDAAISDTQRDALFQDYTSNDGSSLSPELNSRFRDISNTNLPVFGTGAGEKHAFGNNIANSSDTAVITFPDTYHLQSRPLSESLTNIAGKFLPLATSETLSNSLGPFGFAPLSKSSTCDIKYAVDGLSSSNLNAMISKAGHMERSNPTEVFNQIKPLEQHFDLPDNLLQIQTQELDEADVINPYSKNDPVLSSFANFIDGNVAEKGPNTRDTHNPIFKRRENTSPLVAAQENALNPCASNPATTMNFLYGTNVNYAGKNISQCLLQYVPTRERSFELVNRYFSSVHVLLPIMVNVEDFISEHTRFWSHITQTSGNNRESFDFLSFFTLYFPIVYASTISEFEEYDNLLLNQEIDRYLKAFNKVCQHYNYPHGLKSISLLLGNVIIQSTSPNPSTMEMSQIIRYAKFLHLHKDPFKTLRIEDWKVVRFRRKLWWVIFGLDALSSHNFCLPPVCRFGDFNVEIPEHYDPVFNESGELVEKVLNVSDLAMSVKCQFDRILSDLVYHLHNGLSSNISDAEIEVLKKQICSLFACIHQSVSKITSHYRKHPPKSVSEMNLFHFVKNHAWSFADRALMLLHKKMLLADRTTNNEANQLFKPSLMKRQTTPLSLSVYEDTFGYVQEKNIIRNFHESPISQLRFTQKRSFSYEDIPNNLIPSILHNLNDFLKYNDFIKFGKFNWYIKRTIPLDSIILLLVIMCVKFKYEYMGSNEIVIFVKLINKTLFILNKKYFKNEKYKRMLSLTNTTYEYILKKYDVANLIEDGNGGQSNVCIIEFMDHQIVGVRDTSELFTIMDVPRPELIQNGHILSPPEDYEDISFNRENITNSNLTKLNDRNGEGFAENPAQVDGNLQISRKSSPDSESRSGKAEILQLNQKIYYDLRNNFVDVNDYCSFYLSLENVLHSLMDYINDE